MTSQSVPFVRTPDENFVGLEEFDFEPHYADLNGLRMHYVDEGPRGAPVALMVHGMPTWSYLYRSVIPVMREAGYRCVAADHIGFGRSDKVTDASWYDIATHTANLSRLITKLDLGRITLFVQDWGGPIGLAQVVEHPERFSRLVIMNTWLHHTGYQYSAGIRKWIAQNRPGGLFRESVPNRFNWGTLLLVGTRRESASTALYPALADEPPALATESDAVRRAYDAPFAGLGDEGLVGTRQFPLCIPVQDPARGNGHAQQRHFEVVNRTTLPVHFVWGAADDVFTRAWGRSWHAAIPGSTWDEFDDAGHFLPDTHGGRIAARVLSYET